MWYHRCQNNSFLGWWLMVFCQLYYTIPGEELFVLGDKKCRIYAACGVSQTPNVFVLWGK